MNVFELFAKISLNTSAYDKGIKDSESKAKSASSVIGGGLATAAKVGATAIGIATTAVGALAGASVKTGAKFDKSMAQVAATMGKNVDEIQDLRDFALDMGSKTAFSASEAADALNYMALAGYDSEKSIKMLPNVLNLAAAGGIDLAEASDMVTDAQSALGLSTKETESLVDKMAKASSKSNTSVAQLGSAILTVGGTAKNLKGGTTELSQALGLLADNGIKGAEGGTALRNILLNLTPKSKDAAEAMEQIGLQAYDADGKMRPLKDVFADLNKGMEGMSDKEKTEILSNIFNKVDLKSVNALLSTSADRWDELGSAIDNSKGAAEKMAETQLDNLSGDITLFKSALEGAQIAISDQLTPSLRDFVQFGTDGIGRLSEAFQKDGISGAFSVLGDLLSEALDMIVDKLPMAVDAGAKLLTSLANGIIDNLPKLLSVAIEIVSNLVNGISQNLPQMATSAVKIISDLAQFLIKQLPQLTRTALQLILGLAKGLIQAMPQLLKEVPKIINGLIDALIEMIPDIIDAGIQLLESLADGLPEIINNLVEIVPQIVEHLSDTFIKNGPKLAEAGFRLIISLIKNLPKILLQISTAGVRIVASLIVSLYSQIPKMASAGLKALKSIWEKLPEIISVGKENVKEIFNGIKEKFESLSLVEAGKNLIMGLWEGIKNAKDWLFDKVGDLGKGLVDKVKGVFKIKSPSRVFAEIGRFLALGLGEGWEDAFPAVQDGIEDDLTFDVGKAVSDIEASVSTTGIDDGLYTLSDIYNMMSKILNQVEENGVSTVSAIENADTSIVLNDREFGRAVRKAYA